MRSAEAGPAGCCTARSAVYFLIRGTNIEPNTTTVLLLSERAAGALVDQRGLGPHGSYRVRGGHRTNSARPADVGAVVVVEDVAGSGAWVLQDVDPDVSPR